ncbi:uncharacterized protein G2W53_029390 [Senna tora]|uniref:Uncharacterized protein n=1 Tax=Senna tora TaxID=362788 RepID=A0A834WDP2_9FABA|nr:uncharacterized protein G2W53_029390 [Senna tora]
MGEAAKSPILKGLHGNKNLGTKHGNG